MSKRHLSNRHHIDQLPRRNHFMLEWPASTATQFRHDDVAVAEEVDIKVDVVARLWQRVSRQHHHKRLMVEKDQR